MESNFVVFFVLVLVAYFIGRWGYEKFKNDTLKTVALPSIVLIEILQKLFNL